MKVAVKTKLELISKIADRGSGQARHNNGGLTRQRSLAGKAWDGEKAKSK
jgi:hypothetical protein